MLKAAPRRGESRVKGDDVARCLLRRIRPGEAPDSAEVRAQIAEQVGISVDTVKRIEDGKFDWIGLDAADRLLVASGGHLHECEVVNG